MGRFVYYTAASLDGFVADAHGSLAWLDTVQTDPEGPGGWTAFDAGVGAMVMGRGTYDWLVANLPSGSPWPHRQACWVLSHRPDDGAFPGAPITFTADPVPLIAAAMQDAAGTADCYVAGGGVTAGAFARAGLLDEIVVSIAPVVLGGGTPLLDSGIALRLESAERNGDLAALRYSVVR